MRRVCEDLITRTRPMTMPTTGDPSGCVGARASLALRRGPGYVGIKGVIAAMHARHYSVHISRQIRLDETTTGL